MQYKYFKERKQLAKVGRFMNEKQLTNNAGGNISMKVDETDTEMIFVVSPKQAGQLKSWRLEVDDVLVMALNKQDGRREILEGQGALTREINLHMNVYAECPHIKSIIHAHPLNSMAFLTFNDEIPLACENVMKFKRIPVLRFAPATSPELAQVVKEAMQDFKDITTLSDFAVGLRGHGIVVCSKGDLDVGLDNLERIEYNSRAIIDYAAYSHDSELKYPEYHILGDE